MATIQIRVDDSLKQRADALFSDIGIDTSSAIRLFLKQSVNLGRIPFELRADPYREYAQALHEANEEALRDPRRLSLEALIQDARDRIDDL